MAKATHRIIDCRTGAVMGRGTRNHCTRRADKLDLEFGAVRYRVEPMPAVDRSQSDLIAARLKELDATPRVFVPKTFSYFINLDERGEFSADVRDPDGITVLEIGADIFEDGFMRHKHDLDGLRNYMIHLGIMTTNATLIRGN
jgi:hypothetical protein